MESCTGVNFPTLQDLSEKYLQSTGALQNPAPVLSAVAWMSARATIDLLLPGRREVINHEVIK